VRFEAKLPIGATMGKPFLPILLLVLGVLHCDSCALAGTPPQGGTAQSFQPMPQAGAAIVPSQRKWVRGELQSLAKETSLRPHPQASSSAFSFADISQIEAVRRSAKKTSTIQTSATDASPDGATLNDRQLADLRSATKAEFAVEKTTRTGGHVLAFGSELSANEVKHII
jgi:hypothetical protein